MAVFLYFRCKIGLIDTEIGSDSCIVILIDYRNLNGILYGIQKYGLFSV